MTVGDTVPPHSIRKNVLRGVISFFLLFLAAVAVAYYSDLSSFFSAFAALRWETLALVVALFVAGALLSSLRLWLISRDIDHPIGWRDAVSAVTVGYLAGGLFFQVVGQTVARSVLLARRGVPVAATLVMTGYERFVTLIVAFTLAVSGAWFIFGRLVLDTSQGGGAFLRLAGVALLAIVAGGAIGWGGMLLSALKPVDKYSLLGRFIRSSAISVAIQLCTMVAYIVLARSLAPKIPIFELAAATTVVMFAASLPISFAGWGVRELSAVLALSVIGMPTEQALLVAVVIGVLSIGVVALLAGLVVVLQMKWPAAPLQSGSVQREHPDFASVVAWAIPLAAATAVFFQVHVPAGSGGVINVNLADPAAVIGGVLFVIWAMRDRRWPEWRLPSLNIYIIVISLAFAAAFLIGWVSFGWSQWAFTNKFLGWFVLLAYGATGALAVSRFGVEGYRVLLLTLVGAAMSVVVVDLGMLVVHQCCIRIPQTVFRPQLEGFAQNANAFAFQLILIFTVALVLIRSQGWSAAVMTACTVGIWFSSSRSGLATLAVIVIVGMFYADYRRRLLIALLAAAATIAVILLVPVISEFIREQFGTKRPRGQRAAPAAGMFVGSDQASDSERMVTIRGGVDLFLKNPIFGAGLGAFAEQWLRQHGRIQVIHSTPVWLLAEFGVVGTILIAFPFVRMWIGELRDALAGKSAAVVLVLIGLAFGVFSLAHEMFYQRLFWLLLGASLAMLPMMEAAGPVDGPSPGRTGRHNGGAGR